VGTGNQGENGWRMIYVDVAPGQCFASDSIAERASSVCSGFELCYLRVDRTAHGSPDHCCVIGGGDAGAPGEVGGSAVNTMEEQATCVERSYEAREPSDPRPDLLISARMAGYEPGQPLCVVSGDGLAGGSSGGDRLASCCGLLLPSAGHVRGH